MNGKETPSESVANLIRGTTRPILTVMCLISWILMNVGRVEIDDRFTVLTFGLVIWWFGDRSYMKRKAVQVAEKPG